MSGLVDAAYDVLFWVAVLAGVRAVVRGYKRGKARANDETGAE